ncbi:hypothetical protein N0V87_003322 [Didymella glomerata]|uniref:Uncharacterized protein n=1 Tax=Didymella glomerata TaxID=749621 RepID=A0A9W8X2N7_9PLEO|nr:hypothetical protein N0V87_003322 [Didymella glomerata]
MSKRSASSSPSQERHEAKKAKLEMATPEHIGQAIQKEQDIVTEAIIEQTTQEELVDDEDTELLSIDLRNVVPEYAYTFMTESKAQQPLELTVEENPNGTEPATKKDPSKASRGFTPWRPAADDKAIPLCKPHWGIIPRSGDGILDDVTQEPARTSNGKVEPPLWQDRKGSVRVKKGERYINGYDQAYHLWVPLMNLRPRKRDQQPKREPIKYMCEHGMPDWSNSDAIGVANKALQHQIKVNAHEDTPYTDKERNILATIFREQPDSSLLHAAKIFNDRAHPLQDGEQDMGRYPVGRFTESIQHEYRIYKTSYDQGVAPRTKSEGKNSPATKKDVPLENKYEIWLDAKKKAETAAKKAAKATEKVAKSGGEKTKPATNGERKPTKTRKKKNDEDKKATGKTSQSTGVKKPPRFRKNSKNPMTKEQEEYAAANAQAFLDKREAEEKAKADLLVPPQPATATSNEPHLSGGGEQTPELGVEDDAGEARPSFPSGLSARATVAAPPQLTQIAEKTEGGVAVIYPKTTQMADEPLSDIVMGTQPVTIAETTVTETQTTVESEVAVEFSRFEIAPVAQQPLEVVQAAVTQVVVEGKFVDKPIQDIEVDENYEDSDLI